MNFPFAWPDLVIGAILALGIWRGYARGFVSELTGVIALVAAIGAAFVYPGIWDGPIENVSRLGPGSSHVIGLLAFAALAYGVVAIAGAALGRIAKLPILGLFNALLGAAVGFLKAAAFVWIVLFIALWFPLSKDFREDLHRSYLVSVFAQPFGAIDTYLKKSLPWFAKPFSNGVFGRHQV
ncbi:MAG: CvpA family protein [Candidatus Eremiobacteraeota bacterium]|nr:CvpA family protein [Candidatus Eremiobacteraeota bacterium]